VVGFQHSHHLVRRFSEIVALADIPTASAPDYHFFNFGLLCWPLLASAQMPQA
jgi:hypothetical protein